jgi:UDPglucose 6-dehydrogenase
MQRSDSGKISIFGLGKLGAVIAGCYACRQIDVIGVDVSPAIVQRCHSGVPPVQEPGIDELYLSGREHLTASMDGPSAVLHSSATIITVPTPSEPDGGYSIKYVLEACAVIGEAIRKKDAYHLVVLKSTVLPGACDNDIVPHLEAHSGKRCGEEFGFCYNPEFIALGSVIKNIYNPDLTLIGESDPYAGDLLQGIHEQVVAAKAPIARMNLVNAEIVKLAVNTFVTMKISFANLLAGVCERLPGGDVDTVTDALGRDSRIGPKYIRGGLGFGGPCFPRDNAAMLSLARRLGVSFPLAEATDRANEEIPRRIAGLVTSQAPAGGRVAILGLSYKPDTPVIEESQSILIANLLMDDGLELQAYDPSAMPAAAAALGDRVRLFESAQACIAGADVILIATPWKQFKHLNYNSAGGSKPATVIDCWGLLDGEISKDVSLIRLGVSPTQPMKTKRPKRKKSKIAETLNAVEE